MKNLLLEKLNTKISDDLGVEKLKIKYEVSTRAKSKFGHLATFIRTKSIFKEIIKYISKGVKSDQSLIKQAYLACSTANKVGQYIY